MKKIAVLLFMVLSINAHAQNEKFVNLQLMLATFDKLESYKSIGSYEMWQKAGMYVDDQLAWEFLWQKNKFMKPEETFSQQIGWKKLNDNVAIVIFFTGQKDNTLAYMLSVQTYDIKKGKMIDELRNVGSFGTKEGVKPACNLYVGKEGALRFTTSTSSFGKETIINLDISNKGKIKEAK